MYNVLILLMIFVGVGSLACGGKGSGGGFDSPEAVVKALVEAGQAGDGAKVKALFPTQAQLDAAMTCEADRGPAKALLRAAEAWSKDVDEIKDAMVAFVGMELREPEVVKANDEKDGCKAKVEVVMQRGKARFKDKDGGDEGEGLGFIKLGDAGWFLAR